MFGRKKYDHKIYPDEIFLDSKIFPVLTPANLKYRLEKPIGKKLYLCGSAYRIFLGLFFASRIFYLQVFEGEKFTARSERNSFKKKT